jgi:hypothetical protein
VAGYDSGASKLYTTRRGTGPTDKQLSGTRKNDIGVFLLILSVGIIHRGGRVIPILIL